MEKAINNTGESFMEGTEHLHSDWEMVFEFTGLTGLSDLIRPQVPLAVMSTIIWFEIYKRFWLKKYC